MPVRSLLGFSWESKPFVGGVDHSVPRSDIANGPTTLQSFTRFVGEGDRDDASVFFSDERFQEVWSAADVDDENVAVAVVDLLGVTSKAGA